MADDHHATGEESSESEEAVRVFVRIRPLNKRELGENQTIGWNFDEKSMIEETQNGQRVYAYDHCFGPDSTNQQTYDIVGKPVVLKAMDGYNGTVFTCKYLSISNALRKIWSLICEFHFSFTSPIIDGQTGSVIFLCLYAAFAVFHSFSSQFNFILYL